MQDYMMGTPKREGDAKDGLIKDRHIGGSTADASEEKKRDKLLPPIEAKPHKDFLNPPPLTKSGGNLVKPGSKAGVKPIIKGGKKPT